MVGFSDVQDNLDEPGGPGQLSGSRPGRPSAGTGLLLAIMASESPPMGAEGQLPPCCLWSILPGPLRARRYCLPILSTPPPPQDHLNDFLELPEGSPRLFILTAQLRP